MFDQTAADQTHAQRARWMIVDDNLDVLNLLVAVARSTNRAEVSGYRSGAEALEAFVAAPAGVELVITDLEMPQMDGLSLSRQLLARAPHLKILLTTGSGLLSETEARQFGLCGLLNKPFLPSDLLETLTTLGLLSGSAAGKRNPAQNPFAVTAKSLAAA